MKIYGVNFLNIHPPTYPYTCLIKFSLDLEVVLAFFGYLPKDAVLIKNDTYSPVL